jgi:hypothetical protein
MQITLFRALQGIKIPDDQAAGVVAGVETHVETVANNNIKDVEAKLTGMQATLDAMRGQIQFVGVMIQVVGVMLGIIGLAIAAGPIAAKFIH